MEVTSSSSGGVGSQDGLPELEEAQWAAVEGMGYRKRQLMSGAP